MRVETLQQPGKEATGSRHGPEVARQTVTAETESIGPPTEMLMEEILRRENLMVALKRVQANKGVPGVDGMTVEELPGVSSQPPFPNRAKQGCQRVPACDAGVRQRRTPAVPAVAV